MRKLIIITLCFIAFSSAFSNAQVDMKYHGTPTYYWNVDGLKAIAGYFEPSKFAVNCNFKIKTIGQIGYVSNGQADVYIFLSEVNNHPDCTPPEFTKKKYGPYSGHINNSYPNYDDLDIYNLNWYIRKSEIDEQVNKRFWIIYYFPTSPPPYPFSDEAINAKNSTSYLIESGWTTSISDYYPCWCMHCVVYWGVGIENTSLGVVRALFS